MASALAMYGKMTILTKRISLVILSIGYVKLQTFAPKHCTRVRVHLVLEGPFSFYLAALGGGGGGGFVRVVET